jgi:hypothetical protein
VIEMSRYVGTYRRAALSGIAVALLLAPAFTREALADTPRDRARSHYGKGKALYESGDYKAAIAEFAAADSIEPAPLLEFNIALCYERLGDSKEAVRRYRVYLERKPNAANRGEVEIKVKRLEAEIATAAAASESRRTAPPPPEQEPAAETGPAEEAGEPPRGEAEPPAAGASEPPPPTGDAELDRANRIDVAAIRDARIARAPRADGPPTPPPGQPGAGPATAPHPGSPVRDAPKKSKPAYKQWWFWVVMGVATLILIEVATSDSGSDGNALQLPDMAGMERTGVAGPVLLRF